MTMKKIIMILVWLVGPIAALAYEPVDTLTDEDPYFLLMGEADRAIADENWTEAAARLNDALGVRPTHPSNSLLLTNLATVYTYQGLDSLALDAYDRALDIAPSMVMAMLGKGRLLLRHSRDYEAYETFGNAIATDSLNCDARYYHGMMALYGGNMSVAESDFAVLRTIRPEAVETALAMSSLYSLTGRDREAVPYYQRLVELEPSPEYYAALAGCYLQLGKLTEASETLGQAFEKYPSDPELYYYRAWLNRDRYRLDDAHDDARRAVELGANRAKVEALFGK